MAEKKDGVKNYSGNFNFEKIINNIQFNNSTYFRETEAEYDNSSTNENDYIGNNKMLTTQFNINFLEKNLKRNLRYIKIYTIENIMNKVQLDYYDSSATGLNMIFQNF